MKTLRQAVEAVKDYMKRVKNAPKNFKILRSTIRHYFDRNRGVRLIAKQERGREDNLALHKQDKKNLAKRLKVIDK